MWTLSEKNIAPNIMDKLLSPFFVSQQDEAYEMIKKYGKDKAIVECDERIKTRYTEIHSLKFYDTERIEALDKAIYFWIDVKILCLNWVTKI